MKRESKERLNIKKLKYNSQNQQKTNIFIPGYMKKEISLSKQTLLPYDETHTNCERHFLYFTSRLAIIYNPLSKTQRIYQGHRYKITCLSVHPSSPFFIFKQFLIGKTKFTGRIVASGESSARPFIHVWNVINLEPYKILRTYHKNGIINLAFSRDGALIVSLGMDKNFRLLRLNLIKFMDFFYIKQHSSHKLED